VCVCCVCDKDGVNGLFLAFQTPSNDRNATDALAEKSANFSRVLIHSYL
jgi:hypothetical protein